MSSQTYDLVVIGSGPGGEVGAIKAAELGLRVALVEKNPYLGGTCLNVGCIPTKALIEAAKTYDKFQHGAAFGFETGSLSFRWDKIMARKDTIVENQRKGLALLLKQKKVDVFTESHARLKEETHVEVTKSDGSKFMLETRFVLLAMGSRVKDLPFAKTKHKDILTSDSILFIDHVPESMAIIGGGVIGMEFASLFSRFGSKITVIELLPQILPYEDAESAAELEKILKRQKIKIETATRLKGLEAAETGVKVVCEGKEDRSFEKVLVSVGRGPVTDDAGLDNVNIRPDQQGFISRDEYYRTSVENIFAIGDIIRTPALAHTASAEATCAVEMMAGRHPVPVDYSANPSAVYTQPEVASVGATEKDLREKNIEYSVAKFPFAAVAKSMIEGSRDGFVKLLYDSNTRKLLGAHIVHAKATELISELALAKSLGATIDDIGRTIHPHPTISEAVMEAARSFSH